MLRPDKRLLRALAPGKVNYGHRTVMPSVRHRLGRRVGIGLHLRTFAPIGLFVAGVACIAASVLAGDAEVSLLLIFPVFSGSSGLFVLGTVLIVFSFVVGFIFLMMGQVELASPGLARLGEYPGQDPGRGDTKYGGVVLVGPLPIAFGSDRKIALAMLVLGIVLAIVALVVLALLLG
jgi:uncharacterized protein (TIGR00304 family)